MDNENQKESANIKRFFDVESSNVERIGYSPDDKVLAVTFKGGATYHYLGFRIDHWADLCCADSIGKFFHARIKGKFDSEKIRGKN